MANPPKFVAARRSRDTRIQGSN